MTRNLLFSRNGEPRWGSWGGLGEIGTQEFKAVLPDCFHLELVPGREGGLTSKCIGVL